MVIPFEIAYNRRTSSELGSGTGSVGERASEEYRADGSKGLRSPEHRSIGGTYFAKSVVFGYAPFSFQPKKNSLPPFTKFFDQSHGIVEVRFRRNTQTKRVTRNRNSVWLAL